MDTLPIIKIIHSTSSTKFDILTVNFAHKMTLDEQTQVEGILLLQAKQNEPLSPCP